MKILQNSAKKIILWKFKISTLKVIDFFIKMLYISKPYFQIRDLP